MSMCCKKQPQKFESESLDKACLGTYLDLKFFEFWKRDVHLHYPRTVLESRFLDIAYRMMLPYKTLGYGLGLAGINVVTWHILPHDFITIANKICSRIF